MELAEDVVDGNGQPMLRAGTILSERDLRRFRMWGIMEIAIRGEEAEDETNTLSLTAEQLAAAEPLLRATFRHANLENPLIKLLYEERLRRTAREQEVPSHGGA